MKKGWGKVSMINFFKDQINNVLYNRFVSNIRTISGNKHLHISKELWYEIIDYNEVKYQDLITINDKWNLIYDVVMPIDNVCRKNKISRSGYMKLYCKDKDYFGIKTRRKIIDQILGNEIDTIRI